jgi:hypothetical protein
MELEGNLDLFILQSYSDSDLDDGGVGSIRRCTEYHKFDARTDEQVKSIRCHPYYREKGYSWYDWALVRFVNEDGQEDEFPSRVVSCIPCQSSIAGMETTKYDIIFQCCSEPSGRESYLFTEWAFDKKFYFISAEAIVCLCFVLESPDLDSGILVVADKVEWASYFYESAKVKYAIPSYV